MLVVNKSQNSRKRHPSNFFLWVITVYSAIFSITLQRYELALSRLTNTFNSYIEQLDIEKDQRELASGFQNLQGQDIPFPPNWFNPLSVLKSGIPYFDQPDAYTKRQIASLFTPYWNKYQFEYNDDAKIFGKLYYSDTLSYSVPFERPNLRFYNSEIQSLTVEGPNFTQFGKFDNLSDSMRMLSRALKYGYKLHDSEGFKLDINLENVKFFGLKCRNVMIMGDKDEPNNEAFGFFISNSIISRLEMHDLYSPRIDSSIVLSSDLYSKGESVRIQSNYIFNSKFVIKKNSFKDLDGSITETTNEEIKKAQMKIINKNFLYHTHVGDTFVVYSNRPNLPVFSAMKDIQE